MHLPVSILTGLSTDDALFLNNAENLSNGKWLGSFTHLTLVKGPFYSIFLALNYFLGIPVTLSISVFYSYACYLLVYSLGNIGMPFILGFLLYILLLFQPALMPTRIIRDNVYTSLTLVAIATLLLVLSNKHPWKNSALCGFALAAFSMTREEDIWIAPGIFVLLVGAFIMFRKGFYGDCCKPIKGALVLLFLFICFLLPIQVVSFINFLKYDFYGIVDIKGKGFKDAFNSLQSVVFGDPQPFLPLPSKTRLEIYKYAPSFAELREILEYDGNFFKYTGVKFYPQTANDFAGGWFMWAFRDAVAKKGYYKSGSTAEAYYFKLASEIKSAQEKGLLPKVFSPISLMPPLSRYNLSLIPAAFLEGIKLTVYQVASKIPLTAGPSWEPVDRLNRFKYFLGNPKTMPLESEEGQVRIHGWYQSETRDWLQVVSNTGEFSSSNLQRLPSPDLVKHFGDPQLGYNRFSFKVKINSGQFIKSDSTDEKISIKTLISKQKVKMPIGNGYIYLDGVADDSRFKEEFPATVFKKILLQFYQVITPPMVLSAALCLVIVFFVLLIRHGKSSAHPLLIFVCIATLVFYVSRLGIVVLVDICSFPSINTLYLAPAFPLIPVFSFISYSLLYIVLINDAKLLTALNLKIKTLWN
jgi:hypothetical protein